MSLCPISIDEEWFKDEKGRVILFRGTNVPAKIPALPKYPESLLKHKQVSFVGRPFPLEEADEHFTRLKFLGFTLLRLGVSWEAIAHEGPNRYDEAYIEYIHSFIEKAREHGLYICIDFHQDVWSRFTGGDGAPGWTLELIGFELSHLEKTGSTVLHNKAKKNHHLLWPTNAYKLGAATLFTLFFGGNVFAPKKKIEGMSSQDFLQHHYLEMMSHLARKIKDLDNIIGYDVMNEPLFGYIGCTHLDRVFGLIQFGDAPTPIQSMALGDGIPTKIGVWEKGMFRLHKTSEHLVNEERVRAWKEGIPCVWKEAGVWDVNSKGIPEILRPDYFSKVHGKAVHFEDDFYKPFLLKAQKKLLEVSPQTIVFIENVVGRKPPTFHPKERTGIAFTGHWYDAFVLVMKRFWPFVGYDMLQMRAVIAFPRWMRRSFASQIARMKHYAREKLGNVPTLVGEFGVPLDLNKKKAYKTGDFTTQNKALNRSFVAIEDNLLSAIIWNYSPYNSNTSGDDWNDEDLSIFSLDQHFDINHPYSGMRAKEALIRPYTYKTAGIPLYMHFDMKRGVFEFVFEHNRKVKEPTEIFLPALHFKKGFFIQISDGDYTYDTEKQMLYYRHTELDTLHYIRIQKQHH